MWGRTFLGLYPGGIFAVATYRTFLETLARDGLIDGATSERLARLTRIGTLDAVALTAHEILRSLVARGKLVHRSGHLDRPGTALSAANLSKKHIYTLPDLITAAKPDLRLPLSRFLGPAPSFAESEIPQLFHDQSAQILAPQQQSADVRGVIDGILSLLQRITGAPAAACFTQTLPVPNALNRGLEQLRPAPNRPLPDLDAAMQRWISRALEDRAGMLSLPDLSLLRDASGGLTQGSAVLIPLCSESEPAARQSAPAKWEAVLAVLAPRPYWFTRERLARLRLFAPHFRRHLTYTVWLQGMISTDPLTSVYNREFFNDQLGRVLAGAQRAEHSFSLLIVDIDDFKMFNSNYGYDAGDEVLCKVAAELKQQLRATDVLARYGGEEFAVILAPPVSREQTAQVGERLRAAVENLQVKIPTLAEAGGEKFVTKRVTISIGGAVYPKDGKGRDPLWNRANRMLHAAKEGGKNRVCFPWNEKGAAYLHVMPLIQSEPAVTRVTPASDADQPGL